MGKMTTHVLDTSNGCPAAGMAVALYRLGNGGAAELIKRLTLNHDGRADGAVLLAAVGDGAGRGWGGVEGEPVDHGTGGLVALRSLVAHGRAIGAPGSLGTPFVPDR